MRRAAKILHDSAPVAPATGGPSYSPPELASAAQAIARIMAQRDHAATVANRSDSPDTSGHEG